MRIIEGIENINETFDNLCVALGTFDGIHQGHHEVINGAIQKAKEINGTSMVFTFSPNPLDVIASSNGPQLINSKEEKIHILKNMGLDILIFANFTVEFSDLHPEQFFNNILKDILNVKLRNIPYQEIETPMIINKLDNIKTGATGADIEIIIEKAKIYAERDNRDYLTGIDLESSLRDFSLRVDVLLSREGKDGNRQY